MRTVASDVAAEVLDEDYNSKDENSKGEGQDKTCKPNHFKHLLGNGKVEHLVFSWLFENKANFFFIRAKPDWYVLTLQIVKSSMRTPPSLSTRQLVSSQYKDENIARQLLNEKGGNPSFQNVKSVELPSVQIMFPSISLPPR